MLRLAALPVVAALATLGALLTTPASAVVLLTPDGTIDSARQAIIARFPVPTPATRLTVRNENCPGPASEGYSSCAVRETDTIWLSPKLGASDRFVLGHELGHFFDYYMFDDIGRARFLQLIGQSGSPWRTEGGNSPHEKFAEAYRWCAMHRRIHATPGDWGYDYRPPPRLHARVCALIRSYRA